MLVCVRNRSTVGQWVRVLALLVMLGGYAALVRANDLEASAISRAGGDAGMWGVGLIFWTAFLLPALGCILLSLVLGPRSEANTAISTIGGLALVASAAWLATNLYPPDKETDEGRPLDHAMWEHVADVYLAAFVLLGTAGALLLLTASGRLRGGPSHLTTAANTR